MDDEKVKGDGSDWEPYAHQKLKLGKKAKNWLELINFGWFGLDLRIFNLTHQKRLEAKVDLGGHFKNMSK